MDSKLQNPIELGQYVTEALGVPSSGKYIQAGTTVLKSEYPELTSMYPQLGQESLTTVFRTRPYTIPTSIQGCVEHNGIVSLSGYSSGVIYYTLDYGITWFENPMPNFYAPLGLYYENGMFFISAYDSNNNVFYLYKATDVTDNLTFVNIAPLSLDSFVLGVQYHIPTGTLYLFTSSKTFFSTNMGDTFNEMPTPTPVGMTILFKDNLYFLPNTYTNYIYKGSLTAVWDSETIPLPTSQNWAGFICDKDQTTMAVINGFGQTRLSHDGITWFAAGISAGLNEAGTALLKNRWFRARNASHFYTGYIINDATGIPYATPQNNSGKVWSNGVDKIFFTPNNNDGFFITSYTPYSDIIDIPEGTGAYLVRVK